jgi:glycosyltransferase involved in cell wall biosynthesis
MIVTNSLTGGGAERSMNLVSNELFRRGWPIALVPINSSPADQVIPQCEVFPLERKWRGKTLDTFYAVWKFQRLVRKWRPDFIVLNCDLPELFGAIVHGKHRLIVLEHASYPWSQRSRLGRLVRKILECRNVIWIAVSSHLTIWPKGKKPTCVLQNPLVSLVSSNPHTSGHEIKRLVFIGRLSPEKRPELALEISHLTAIESIFIGDGVMLEGLKWSASKKSISAGFLGHLESPWQEIRTGDLLISSSKSEGDGLVVVEALQRNIPMLLAETPDFRRFGFPDINYCSDAHDFVHRITLHMNKLETLTIPESISHSILSERQLETIGNEWEIFLSQLVQE